MRPFCVLTDPQQIDLKTKLEGTFARISGQAEACLLNA